MSQVLVALALPLGFLAGAFVAFFVVRRLARMLPSSLAAPQLVRGGSVVGAVVAVLPSAFAAIALGGTLGGGWAEQFLGERFVPLGLFTGIALVFAALVTFGAAVGALLGRLLVAFLGSRTNAA